MNKFLNMAFCAVLAVSFVPTTAFAGAISDKINKRAAEMNELKGLLNSADENVRLAAINTLLKSEDTATKAMAYAAGYASKNVTIRAITLRNHMNEISSMNMDISLPENNSEKAKEIFIKYTGNGQLDFKFSDYKEIDGSFRFVTENKNSSYHGSVSGLVFNTIGAYCFAKLILNETAELVGNLNCKGHIFPAKLRLL
jgi:hypothetical protein